MWYACIGTASAPPPVSFCCMQVEDYMEQLDNTKIPKVGSRGEKYRDIQLVVQLPKQDLSHDYCRHLAGADQRKAFDEFKHVRDATAMEIGLVKEVHDDTVSGGCCCHGDRPGQGGSREHSKMFS